LSSSFCRNFDFTGKVVFVTGASRGIGRTIAEQFVAAGATVAVAARSLEELEELARRSGGGDRVLPIRLDVTDEAACEAAVRTCEDRFGAIDVLVNNAGSAASRSFVKTDTELWRRLMAINVEGSFWVTRTALPAMLERGSGAVITVASLAAKRGYPYISAYAASKHAVLGMMRALAAEHARSGVTFNCVCPHYADTPMTDVSIENIIARTGRSRAEALAPLLSPQGRLISSEEVAGSVLYLASPLGASINGQALNVDGGELQS
jgi:NAD(P)-dependent dehydrogenase (short-subunit alcohol dehydrogenase family)